VTRVRGENVHEQAVAVAGALAELGVREVVIVSGGECRVATARETDLPGFLEGAAAGSSVECAELGVVIHVTAAGLSWDEVDSSRAAAFRRALSAS
jgi:hypothetical protein